MSALQSTNPRHSWPLTAWCTRGRTSHPDARHPHCAPGIAAAVFSWIRRNRWQSHRGSGKAVDIQVSDKGWRHQAWCSGSSAARVETKPQCQSAHSRARSGTSSALVCPLPLHSTLTLRSPVHPALYLCNPLAPAPPVRSLRRWPCPHHIVLGLPSPIHRPTTQHTNGEPSRTLYKRNKANRKERINKKVISGFGPPSPYPPSCPGQLLTSRFS